MQKEKDKSNNQQRYSGTPPSREAIPQNMPSPMPVSLHKLIVRLGWLSEIPAEHQVCYRDMTYVRRGSFKSMLKRWWNGEDRFGNIEKIYSDVREGIDSLKTYINYPDYQQKISKELMAVYHACAVIAKTTYYDDAAIKANLMLIRSEIESTLKQHHLCPPNWPMLADDTTEPMYIIDKPEPYRKWGLHPTSYTTAAASENDDDASSTTCSPPRLKS